MNKKGFTITVILYAMVILIVAIFALLLGTLKNRYKVKSDIQDKAMYYINNPNGPKDTAAEIPQCNEVRYNGEYQTLTRDGSNIRIENNTAKDAGDHDVTVIAEDFYAFSDGTHKKTLTCKIKPGVLSHTASDANVTYDGLSHGISVSSTLSTATIKYGTSNGTYNLSSSPTYVEAGQNTVYYQITAPNYETVTGSKKVIINKRDITYTSGNSSKTYDGVALTNNTVTLTSGSLISGHVITKNVTGTQTNVGSSNNNFTVTIKDSSGNNKTSNYNINYTPGTLTVNAKDASGFTVSLDNNNYDYTGSEIKPTITIKDGTKTLTKDTDYTLSYSNNKEAGVGTVTVTYKGNYNGNATKTFNIIKDASYLTINVNPDSYGYTGSAIIPTVIVKDGTKTLTENTDYTINLSNNINIGTGTVTVIGKGNYKGSKETTFSIVDTTPPSCSFSGPSQSPIYTGATTTFTLTCTDISGFSDSVISSSDFTLSTSGIVTISAPTKTSITNGYKYTITVMGVKVGKVTLTLKEGSVSDGAGNKNTVVTSPELRIRAEYNVMGTVPSIITSYRSNITEIHFINDTQDNIDARYNTASIKANITNTSHSVGTTSLQSMSDYGKVLSWLEPVSGTSNYKLYIGSEGYTYLSTGSSLFNSFSSATTIDTQYIRTNYIVEMQQMFYNCSNLTSLDVSNFDTSNVIDMHSMFDTCSGLTSLDLSNFTMNKVNDVHQMFQYCSSLTSLSIDNWNTGNISNMANMFLGCSNLNNLNLNNWNTGNVTIMQSVFKNCSNLDNLILNNWNVKKVTNMTGMFAGLANNKSNVILDLSGWDTSSVTTTNLMFGETNGIKTIYVGPNWNTTNVTNGSSMFSACKSLVGGNGTRYSTSHIDVSYAHVDAPGNPGYLSKLKLCKRATTLHTETCSQTSDYCAGDGYASGSTITYGNLGSEGTLTTGDAFDCDVNGDGEYNSETERFYYVTDMNSDTAVLIYYNNVSGGLPNNMSTYIYNSNTSIYLGPQIAILQLPTIEQWKNVSLTNTTRDIKDETGTTRISGFSYEGYAARLLTTQEVSAGCGFTVGKYNRGEVSTKCKFLMENTKYSSNSLRTHGPWLETPRSSTARAAWIVLGSRRNVFSNAVNDINISSEGVRPVIEVLKSDIEI